VFTARGVGLLASGLVGLATGFAFGYPELAVLGAAALAAVGYAFAHAAWRPRLAVTRTADPDRVVRGEASTVTLTVHNGSRLRAATLVAHDRCGPLAVPVPLLRLRPRRDTTVSYPVPTQRRGVVAIGPLRVTRRDPFGLVSVARSHGESANVWVHPRSYPLAAVPAGITRSLDGRIDRVPHGSITFATLREYVVGDELRHVHWRTSAKVGELMVREHLDTSLPRLVVLLDNRLLSWPDATDAGESDRFESACEAAASVVTAAAREDLPIALFLVADPTPAVGGNGRRRDAVRARGLLDRLAEARLSTADGDDPLRVATSALRAQRTGDTLVYLTGAGGLDDLDQVAALRGPYPAVLAAVFGTDQPVSSSDILVLSTVDGAAFAAAWDSVRSW